MNKNYIIIFVGGLIVILLILVVVIAVSMIMKTQSYETPPTVDVEAAIAKTVAAFTPTNTPLPTHTATLTPSVTPTPKPTKTNTATATPLPKLPTRTPIPTGVVDAPTGDPARVLGEPTWVEPFHDDSAFSLVDNECMKSEIRDGLYIMSSKNAPSGLCWEFTWLRTQNAYLRTRVHNPKPCDGRDRFGILFRAPDTRHGYFFGLTCEREYWLSAWDGRWGPWHWAGLSTAPDTGKRP